MKCSADLAHSSSSVARRAEPRVQVRSPFLGTCFLKRLQHSCSRCKLRSESPSCTTASLPNLRGTDLSECYCSACKASRGPLSAYSRSEKRRTRQYCAPSAPSFSDAASEVADVSFAAEHGNGRHPPLGSNGAGRATSSSGNGASSHAESVEGNRAHSELVRAPEDLLLEPGELSTISRSSEQHPADVFRCTGCSEPACQVLPQLSTSMRIDSQHAR